VKDFVKKLYGSIAKDSKKTCCGHGQSCDPAGANVSEKMGYTKEELDLIPGDADMGLGCGNPTAFASLKEGEVVVDLGSGGGIDVFLAAKRVGETGKAIGIDMTEAMIDKATENAKKGGFNNVEFKLGDIEDMPLDNGTADCIISNCVINLADDKQKVFNEAFRVLKPEGRLMVSDMVLLAELPESIMKSSAMYAGCISGALKKEDYLGQIKTAGFNKIDIIREDPVQLLEYIGSDKVISDIIQDLSQEEVDAITSGVVSIKISAQK